jgi:hypothetical protein
MKRSFAVSIIITQLVLAIGFAAEREVISDELLPPARVPVVGPVLEAPALPPEAPLSILNASPVIENHVVGYSPVAAERRLVSLKDVDYRYHRGGAKGRFCKDEMKETCVVVQDPCDKCCELEIPVCVPCCCEAPCSMNCRKGILGRTITEYCWECGFRLEVVATKHGDFIVHHYGVK